MSKLVSLHFLQGQMFRFTNAIVNNSPLSVVLLYSVVIS